MRVAFTKMQGAGNDFVVLDETRAPLALTPAQYRWLADRHFGVGADQILSVRPARSPDVDFEYVIHNADGAEVEQCGNGARCFARYVLDAGLTDKTLLRVRTRGGDIAPRVNADGSVTVDMGAPRFDPAAVPFEPGAARPRRTGDIDEWPLSGFESGSDAPVFVSVLSMGNPHAVLRVTDVDRAPVAGWGPRIEHHPAFPQRVNAGFMQVLARDRIGLRVWERGAGETLACGTGACAAAVAGMRMRLLDARVTVLTRGGPLAVEWAAPGAPVLMTGPAETVFRGEIDIPDQPPWPR